jgi:TonB family protein
MTALLLVLVRQSLVLVVALAATAMLRRRSAAVRHWILTAAVTCALAMPLLELVSPRWQVRIPTIAASVTPAGPTSSPEPREAAPAAPRASRMAALPAGDGADPLTTAALAIWIGGAAFGIGALALALARLARVTRSAQPVHTGPIRAMADGLSQRLGVSRGVTVRHSHESALAFTWGFVRPQIVLPASASEWSAARLGAVLRHELAHVARRDWAIQVAAALGRAVWWFNPLVWIACRELRRESELAADDIVLGAGVDGADYATHLVEIARDAAVAHGPWLTAPSIVHRSTLEGRIRAMLNDDLDRRPLTARTRVAASALAVAIALPIAGMATTAAPEASQTAADPGTISGAIYDQAGGLLPGVNVVLVHTQTTGRYEAASDPKGSFAFRNLPPGDYELTTSLPGFNTVKNLLRLTSGASVRRHVTMPLGTIEETITVSPDPPGTTPRTDARVSREIPEPKVPGPCTGAIGGCIKVPRKVIHVSPRYPVELAATGKSGAVVITGRIGIDGYMADMRLRDDAGEDPALQASAVEAVRQWEFEPTRLNNAPVETNITVHVYFNAR